MTISPQLLDLVKAQEGLRLDPYLDAVGVPTIGWGHTGSVSMGKPPITYDQALDLLTADLMHFQTGVKALCPDLPDGARLDALTDFSFNLGLHALHDSTLLRRVLADDWDAAAAECRKWNHAGGVVLAGLTKRRAIEAGWLATGTYEP
jgi:lysozyme